MEFSFFHQIRFTLCSFPLSFQCFFISNQFSSIFLTFSPAGFLQHFHLRKSNSFLHLFGFLPVLSLSLRLTSVFHYRRNTIVTSLGCVLLNSAASLAISPYPPSLHLSALRLPSPALESDMQRLRLLQLRHKRASLTPKKGKAKHSAPAPSDVKQPFSEWRTTRCHSSPAVWHFPRCVLLPARSR